MISDSYQCIFVHIPKNGGASIEALIWPEDERTESDLWMGFKSPHRNAYQTGALQHLYSRYIREAVGEDRFNKYWKFTMVRNPWDKAISQFLYLQKRSDLREFLRVPRHISFVRYLEQCLKKPHVHWAPQVEFIHDANGELIVDYIAKFENYEKEVDFILNKLNIRKPITVPHKNKSNRRSYWQYYTAETKDMVADMYASDIQFFDYSFNEEGFEQDPHFNFPTPSNWFAGKWADLKNKWK